MNARLGELVRVNAAAFTGARFANRESIPCDVLEFRDRRVRVQTRFPYRVFSAWISAEWIEEPVGAAEPAAALAAE